MVIFIIATDFEFDGKRASDFGLIICNIGNPNTMNTISAGSEINFNTVSMQNGELKLRTGVSYDNVLETTFCICKYDCYGNYEPLTFNDKRMISRWLIREDKFCLLTFIGKNEGYDYVCYEACFTLNKIEIGSQTVGYEVHCITNRPFAMSKPIHAIINANSSNYKYKYYDISDKIGYIYPTYLKITCKEDGDLTIHNSVEDRSTTIKNCKKGEVIQLNSIINIETNSEVHRKTIQNDFNYVFFRIANTYDNSLNVLTISIPCKIEFEYLPIIKGVGI